MLSVARCGTLDASGAALAGAPTMLAQPQAPAFRAVTSL